jgi:hypothetical protein
MHAARGRAAQHHWYTQHSSRHGKQRAHPKAAYYCLPHSSLSPSPLLRPYRLFSPSSSQRVMSSKCADYGCDGAIMTMAACVGPTVHLGLATRGRGSRAFVSGQVRWYGKSGCAHVRVLMIRSRSRCLASHIKALGWSAMLGRGMRLNPFFCKRVSQPVCALDCAHTPAVASALRFCLRSDGCCDRRHCASSQSRS